MMSGRTSTHMTRCRACDAAGELPSARWERHAIDARKITQSAVRSEPVRAFTFLHIPVACSISGVPASCRPDGGAILTASQ
jgi:hypothetical protein